MYGIIKAKNKKLINLKIKRIKISNVAEDKMFFDLKLNLPWVKEANKISEYAAAKKAMIPKGILELLKKDISEIKINNSENKFKEVGQAMFLAHVIAHNKVNNGKNLSNPFEKLIFRDLDWR